MKECNRCLLNTYVPGIQLSDSGQCTSCDDFDRQWKDWESIKEKRQSQLEKMFNDCRRKQRTYDVLIPFSGGKDSTYVLYQCKKVFGLKCLAVTWDNGFLSDYAKENIKTTVDALETDHIFYRGNWPLLKKLYRHFFLKTGMFCPVCMRGIGVATNAAAEAFDIPLVVNGTCRRTEEFISPEFFNSGQIPFFNEVLKDSPLKDEASQLFFSGSKKRQRWYYIYWWTKIQRVFSYAVINLPDYIDWDYDVIYNTISRELNWQSENKEDEHGDCLAAPAVEMLRQGKFPALKPELLRYSKYATIGKISKEEARQKVAVSSEKQRSSKSFHDFLDRIDITIDDWNVALKEPLKHMQFVKDSHGPLFKTARTVKRALVRPFKTK